MAWAVEQELPALQKLTLLLLANYAGNESGECWPSLATIAKQAGMSRDSVMRAIRELESAGLLTVVRRTMEGVNLPNTYRLNLSASVRGVVADSNRGSSCERGGVVADSDSNQSLQPVIEPPTPPRVRASARARGTAVAAPTSPTVIELPLNDGTAHAVTEADVQQWARLYPAVNVRAELAEMLRWCNRKPAERKTSRGIVKFIERWLEKEQNEGRTPNAPPQPSRPAAGTSAIERVRAANAAAGHQPGMWPDDDQPF